MVENMVVPSTNTGIAFFDNPSALVGGWCSMNGEKASRFNTSAELSQNAIWITNVKMGDFHSNSLNMTAHIRSNAFFNLPLTELMLELDIKKDDSITVIVEKLSDVASRILNVTRIAFPDIKIKNSLSDSIYEYMGMRDQRMDPGARFQLQLQAASQENSQVTGVDWPTGWEHVTLIPSRVSHAEMIFSYPVPIGALREVHWGDEPVEDFINMDHPGIAQVEVDMSGVENPELIAFGSQMSSISLPREWVTQPEAFMLHAQGVRFKKIYRVIRSDASDVIPAIPDALTNSEFARSSYSAGVVAENIVHALCSKRYMGSASKTAKTKYFFPFRAIYLQSVDRMLTYAMARQLHGMGFRVSRYKLGGVTIRATEDEIPALMDAGANLGFTILTTGKHGKGGV